MIFHVHLFTVFHPDQFHNPAMSHLTFHLGAAEVCITLFIAPPSDD